MELTERRNLYEEFLQSRLIEGRPMGRDERHLVYKQKVVRYSHEPYTFTYSDPTVTITGITCVPWSAKIQSPDAKVTEGGINCKSVTICLTPGKEGKWECEIFIYGKNVRVLQLLGLLNV
jgi:hypothetical protein